MNNISNSQNINREMRSAGSLFNNLPKLLKPEEVASLLKRKIKTIYDWRYRGKTRKNKIPDDFFIKVNGQLLINTFALKKWLVKENPSLLLL